MKLKLNRILFFAVIFFLFSSIQAEASNLSISPANSSYSVGDRVVIKVVASTDIPLNAISGVVKFPTNLFSVESISKYGSILNFWVTEPSFSNQSGTVNFEGVALNGFNTGSGNVITINLRANKEGQGDIVFGSGTILANDGQGTDITGIFNKGTITINKAKEVIKEEKKEEVPIEEEIVIKNNLSAPKIRIGKQEGVLAIIGTSDYKNSNVLLTFTSSKNSKVFVSGQTDDFGNFSLIVPQALRDGTYSVNAVIVLENGDHSQASKNIEVKVGGILKWILYTILIFMIIIDISRRYLYPKNKKQKKIDKEIIEAEETINKSFKILKEDFKDKEVSMEDIKKDLTEAENIIEKEVEDIKDANFDNKN